jgi:GxxExxY protein
MARGKLIEDDLTRSVIGAFYEVYGELGFGFVEYPCALAMERELGARGHSVIREFPAMIRYKGADLCEQRLDMVVDNLLIVEIKSSAVLPPNSIRQLHNYLRATDFEVGLLLHFGPEAKFYRRVLSNESKSRKTKD